MSELFCDRLLLGYDTDPHWKRIASIIDDNAKHNGEGADLSSVCGTDEALIFHRNKFTGLERLCILQALVKDIFEIAHGEGHPGFERSFNIIQVMVHQELIKAPA